MIDVKNAKTNELVAFYNENSGREQIKKFATRAVAERRVSELLDQLDTIDEVVLEEEAPVTWEISNYGIQNCPHCGVNLENGVVANGDEVNGKKLKLDHQFECMACGGGFGKAIKRSANRSEAIRKSWTDQETYEKRTQRSGVEVTTPMGTNYFTSVAKAFKYYELPMSRHIAFRVALKAAGQLEAYDMKWVIVPLNYEG